MRKKIPPVIELKQEKIPKTIDSVSKKNNLKAHYLQVSLITKIYYRLSFSPVI